MIPMTDTIRVAREYFEVSNESDMEKIALLLTPSTTYSSVRQGVFLGVKQIIEMQTAFHTSFDHLNWEIKAIDEIRPGVALIDFVMRAQREGEEMLEIPGDEYVIVHEGKIQHIEVRNKP